MADMEIRRAPAEDGAAVFAIDERIYDSVDYKQAFYDLFVRSPVVTPYVHIAIHDGETVNGRCPFHYSS